MATKEKKVSTVDELVRFAVSNSSEERWILNNRSEWEFADKEAGEVWQAAFDKLRDETPARVRYYYPGDEAEDPELVAAYNKYKKVLAGIETWKPAKQLLTVWWLETSGGSYSWRRDTLYLSRELGEMISEIWKTRPAWHGSTSMKYSGYMTIPGILKRLGRSDVKDQIAAAEERVRLQNEKNSRNSARREAKRLATQLIELVKKYPTISWPADLPSLAELVEEE